MDEENEQLEALSVDDGAADVERINAAVEPDEQQEDAQDPREYELTLEDGSVVACDAEGNILNPEPAQEDEPELGVVPEVPAPVQQEFRSPYANAALTDSELAEAEALGFDPALLGLIDRIADRRSMQAIAAQEQQRAAARQIGVSQEALDEFAPAMRRFEGMVPANVRGTKEGAVTALLMAVGEEAMKGGDLGAVLARFAPKGVATPAPAPPTPRKTPDITPAARSTTPRASSETVTQVRVKGPRDAANASFRAWGIDDDVIGMLQRERLNSKM